MTTFSSFNHFAPSLHIASFVTLICPFPDISSHQQYHQSIAHDLTFSTWSLPSNSLRYCGRYCTFYEWYILDFRGVEKVDIALLGDLSSMTRFISSRGEFWWVAWYSWDGYSASNGSNIIITFWDKSPDISNGKMCSHDGVIWRLPSDPSHWAVNFDRSHDHIWTDGWWVTAIFMMVHFGEFHLHFWWENGYFGCWIIRWYGDHDPIQLVVGIILMGRMAWFTWIYG